MNISKFMLRIKASASAACRICSNSHESTWLGYQNSYRGRGHVLTSGLFIGTTMMPTSQNNQITLMQAYELSVSSDCLVELSVDRMCRLRGGCFH